MSVNHILYPIHRTFNLNNDGNGEVVVVDKEPMFEKPLTPSDVGKLNRLVIPKQHAENYFPLAGGDKGLLLAFEDESGKCWRFRYSYWNSSQSYVLTKGWSRYVKEKRLDAGDVVLFERHRADCGDRFFIGWRRRNAAATPQTSGSGGGARVFYSAHPYPYPTHHGAVPYQQPEYCVHTGIGGSIAPATTLPAGNLKRLRLFGVNMECQTGSSEPTTPDGSSVSSQGAANCHYLHQHQDQYY